MDKHTKDDIRKKLRALESYDSTPSHREAEGLLLDILGPLLQEEGYQLSRTGERRNGGLDFIASRGMTSDHEETSIAIEYKHRKKSSVSVEVIRKILGHYFMQGFTRAMVVSNTRFTKKAWEAVHRSMPIEIELIDIDSLKAWWARIDIDASIDRQEIQAILKTMSWRFAQLVAEDPDNLQKIEWRQVERMLAEVFEGIGFEVELTPPSKDGGKDIILQCRLAGDRKSYIVEIKHWRSRSRVGNKDIREFLDVVLSEEREGGLFLSTFGYCSNIFECLTEIERKKLRFGEQDKVVTLCQQYLKVEAGIWTPQTRLADVLYEGTS